MKKQALLCFVLLSVGFLVAAAQTQPVKITVTNTKGKPLNKALISLKSAPHYRTPGKDGSPVSYTHLTLPTMSGV